MYDPSPLALELWHREPYNGSPWSGASSFGGSGGRSSSAVGTPAPLIGPEANGRTTANFATNKTGLQAPGTLANYATASVMSGWAVVSLPSVTGAAPYYVFWDDGGSTAATVYVYQGGAYFDLNGSLWSVNRAITANARHIITFKYDGTNLKVGVDEIPGANGGASVQVPGAGAITPLTGAVHIGAGPLTSSGMVGTLFELAIAKYAIADSDFTKIVGNYSLLYHAGYAFPTQSRAQTQALGQQDLDCLTDLSPDGKTADGRYALAQALCRRWITDRGSLIDDPDYGTNLTDFINDDMGPSDFPQVVVAAVHEAKKDERVADVVASWTFDSVNNILQLTFDITDGFGPFQLTVAVSALTVDILKVAA